MIRDTCERPEPALLELAVMALCPYERQVSALVLRAELAVGRPVDHLRVVVVPLSVYLVRKVLLVQLRVICHYFRLVGSLKAFNVLIVPRGHNRLFWILGGDVVVLVALR